MAKLKKDLTNLAKSVKKKKDEDIAPVGGISKSTGTTAPFKKAAQMMDNVKSSDRFQEQKRRNAEKAALEKRAKEIEAELLTRPEYAQTAHDMRELDLIAKRILHATDFKETAEKVMGTAEKVKETTENAIAPLKTVIEGMKDTEWLSNAELFDDGYQPWKFELWRTANASMADAVEHLQQGGVDFAEGAIDAGATTLGDLAGKVGWTDAQDFLMNDVVFHDVVNKPWEYVEDGLGIDIPSVHEILGLSDEDIENRSILGEGLEGSTESLAQMMLTKKLAKGTNIPWQAITGVTTYGQGVSEGMEQGLDNEQAKKLGFINAVAEIVTESLFGDSVMGEKGLFDLGKLKSGITIPLLKLAADYGLTIPSNAIEEGLTEAINIAGEAHVRGEDVRSALASEEGLKRIGNSMFSGAVFSAITNAPNAVKAGATGTDFKTGLTKNETEIVERVTDKLVREKESNGEKITDTKRGKIRQSVIEMMDRGEISTDLIEEVFGGETYKKLQDITESEKKIIEKLSQQYSGDELKQKVDSILSGSERNAIKDQLSNEVSKFVQNDRLSESYRQNAEGKVKFNADLSQYNDAERKIVQKAIESGVLNNKRKTHELVDFVAKVAAKLGVDFDFVNNDKLKELGFSVDGADINGYVDKNGNIVINAESSKYLNVVLGHEISHVLEGTELYEAVEKILVDFSVNKKAKSSKFKNEYQERLDRAINLYQNLEGYKGVEGFKNIEREVFADLIGDYLFTDKSFVEHLANTSHKGFQKILDSIESLYKMATAGSKEAKALEKLKQTFMDAFAEAEKKKTTYTGGVKYNIQRNIVDVNGNVYDKVIKPGWTIYNDVKHKTSDYIKYFNKNILSRTFNVTTYDGDNIIVSFAKDGEKVKKDGKGEERIALDELRRPGGSYKKVAILNIREFIKNSQATPHKTENSHGWLDKNGWDDRIAYMRVLDKGVDTIFKVVLHIANTDDGRNILYDVSVLTEEGSPVDTGATALASLSEDGASSAQKTEKKPAVNTNDPSGGILTQEKPGVKKFSLSEQTDKTYMDAVSRGDTKTAQDLVNKAMESAGYTVQGFHGTTNMFYVYDTSKSNIENDWGRGIYATTSEEDAEVNYASENGADLTNRIERLAEMMESMEEYEDMDYDQRLEAARNQLSQGDNRLLHVAFRMQNPVVVDRGNDGTFFTYESEYDEEFDEYSEPTGTLVDVVETMQDIINEEYEWASYDADKLVQLYEDALDWGGLSAIQLQSAVDDILIDVSDEDGNMAGKEILRAAFERMGFDGIVDKSVPYKFGELSGRRYGGMQGVKAGTIHYIAFNSSQVKLSDAVTYDDNGNVIPLSERFNAENDDIRYSLSNGPENTYGDYHISGEDVSFTAILQKPRRKL